MNGMIEPVIVSHNDRIKVIDELKRNEYENHFLLTYMHSLAFEKDYTLIKYGSSYVLNIKNLILSLSYSVEPPEGLKEYISDMNARMVIAPGVENIRELEHIAADEKKTIQCIKHRDCATTPVHHDCRTDFPCQHSAISHCHITGPIHQCLYLRGYIGKVGRRSDNDRIRCDHFGDTFIDDVLFYHTATVLPLATSHAGPAARNGMPPQLKQFRLYSAST